MCEKCEKALQNLDKAEKLLTLSPNEMFVELLNQGVTTETHKATEKQIDLLIKGAKALELPLAISGTSVSMMGEDGKPIIHAVMEGEGEPNPKAMLDAFLEQVSLYIDKLMAKNENSTQPIEPADMKEGDIVTILSDKRGVDRSYQGSLLKIVNISAPFMVMQEVTNRYGNSGFKDVFSLNTEDWNFGKPTQAYIDALTQKAA